MTPLKLFDAPDFTRISQYGMDRSMGNIFTKFASEMPLTEFTFEAPPKEALNSVFVVKEKVPDWRANEEEQIKYDVRNARKYMLLNTENFSCEYILSIHFVKACYKKCQVHQLILHLDVRPCYRF